MKGDNSAVLRYHDTVVDGVSGAFFMVDFSLQASHQFWQSYQDPAVYRSIVFMESTEDKTLDGDPALEEALVKLGDAMHDIVNLDLNEQERFVQIIAHIKMSRGLYIMQTLDSAYAGAASKILSYAEENLQSNPDAELLINRNVIFERLRLLSRVFAQDRLKQLQAVLENV